VEYITRKGRSVQGQVLALIKSTDSPISTRQLAIKLNVSWHTVQHYCFELLLKNEIDRLRVGTTHAWHKVKHNAIVEETNNRKYFSPLSSERSGTKSSKTNFFRYRNESTSLNDTEKRLDQELQKTIDQQITDLLEQIGELQKKKEPQKVKEVYSTATGIPIFDMWLSIQQSVTSSKKYLRYGIVQ
jgi:ATP-dependent Clp protease ATP-binding subunit ClpA